MANYFFLNDVSQYKARKKIQRNVSTCKKKLFNASFSLPNSSLYMDFSLEINSYPPIFFYVLSHHPFNVLKSYQELC